MDVDPVLHQERLSNEVLKEIQTGVPHGESARQVELTQGCVALVDDADFEVVNQHKWYIKRDKRKDTKYAVMLDGTRMHRFILGLPSGSSPLVDHRDLNGLNNQRENLRTCTPAQNRSNTRKSHGSSQFKGVSLKGSRWVAYIKTNKKTKYLGAFEHELVAALAYDAAAREHFGEFARCNFPRKKPCVPCIPASIISLETPVA